MIKVKSYSLLQNQLKSQNNWNKATKKNKKNQVKSEKNIWYLLSQNFRPQFPKLHFGRRLNTRLISPSNFEIFLIFPGFPSRSATREATCIKKFVLGYIKVRFTCGKSTLCQNLAKFQNIMTRIVHQFSREVFSKNTPKLICKNKLNKTCFCSFHISPMFPVTIIPRRHPN